MTTIGVCWRMFLLLLAHPGCPGQNPESHKTVVCVCVRACVRRACVRVSMFYFCFWYDIVWETFIKLWNTHTYTAVLRPSRTLSGTTAVIQHQKDIGLSWMENQSGFTGVRHSGTGIISEALALALFTLSDLLYHTQIYTLSQTQLHQHPTTQFFTDRMLFLVTNQRCQSTEGKSLNSVSCFVMRSWYCSWK